MEYGIDRQMRHARCEDWPEETVGVDFDEAGSIILLRQANGELLRHGFTESGLT